MIKHTAMTGLLYINEVSKKYYFHKSLCYLLHSTGTKSNFTNVEFWWKIVKKCWKIEILPRPLRWAPASGHFVFWVFFIRRFLIIIIFLITLIVSYEAGFKSLCFVAAFCSVAHRVGEASELSGWKFTSLMKMIFMKMMKMIFMKMMSNDDDDDDEDALESVHEGWWEKRDPKCIICTDRRVPAPNPATHFGHKFVWKWKCTSSLLENVKGRS